MANPAPYMGTVEAIVCPDLHHVKELFSRRKLPQAVKDIEGYWNLYLQFYGEQVYWLQFSIVDIRDGCVIWRNGQVLKETGADGESITGNGNPDTGTGPGAGQWLIGNRNAQWSRDRNG